MKNNLILLFIFCISAYPQNNSLHSPHLIKVFADHLYCEKDFLRAVIEYEKYLEKINNDTVRFKAAYSLQEMEDYSKALRTWKMISKESPLYQTAKEEYYKTLFKSSRKEFLDYYSFQPDSSIMPLYFFSKLFEEEDNLPEYGIFINQFSWKERPEVEKLYRKKKDLSFKDPETAAILSAVFPGAGKYYAKNYGDGIAATLTVGALTFLSINSFNNSHNFRGWLFGGLAAFFYAGNIYGAYTSAQIFNAKLKFDFENELNVYLDNINFFITKIDFCK